MKRYASLLGIVLFAYILLQIDFSRLVKILGSVDPIYLFVSALLAPVILFLMAARWNYLLTTLGTKYGMGRSYSSLIKSALLGEVTPGRLGEFLRAKYVINETDTSAGKAIFSVVLDRIYDIAVLVLATFSSYPILFLEPGRGPSRLVIVLLAIVVICAMLMLMSGRVMRRIVKPVARILIPEKLHETARFQFDEFYTSLRDLGPKNHLVCLLYTTFIWLTKFLGLFLLAVALGMEAPFWFIASVGSMGVFISLVPISISGFGTRDAVFIYFLSLRGISAESAVALSFLFLLHGIFGVLASSLFVWAHEKIR